METIKNMLSSISEFFSNAFKSFFVSDDAATSGETAGGEATLEQSNDGANNEESEGIFARFWNWLCDLFSSDATAQEEEGTEGETETTAPAVESESAEEPVTA